MPVLACSGMPASRRVRVAAKAACLCCCCYRCWAASRLAVHIHSACLSTHEPSCLQATPCAAIPVGQCAVGAAHPTRAHVCPSTALCESGVTAALTTRCCAACAHSRRGRRMQQRQRRSSSRCWRTWTRRPSCPRPHGHWSSRRCVRWPAHTHTHVTRACMDMHLRSHIHTCLHTYSHSHMCVCACTCTHTHTCTHAHAQTHTRAHMLPRTQTRARDCTLDSLWPHGCMCAWLQIWKDPRYTAVPESRRRELFNIVSAQSECLHV